MPDSATAAVTLPQLVLENARRRAGRTAMREKEFGIWQSYTWADYADQVELIAYGLRDLGIAAGDRVAIIGDNRPHLYWACVAIQALGATAVPLYQDATADELGYTVGHAGVRAVIAENQEQVDKMLTVRERAPDLAHIVFKDPKGMAHYEDDSLSNLDSVIAAGRRARGADPEWFAARVADGKAEDHALISYTSGSTGNPKGVVLTHANLLASANGALAQEHWQEGDEGMAYLPMAWIGDTAYSLALSLSVGAVVNCPEDPGTVQRDLREIGPTILIGPPRIWENLLTEVRTRMEDADRLKRWMYRRFVALAHDVEAARMTGERVPLARRVLSRLGDVLVYAPLRDQLGLRRIRYAYTGGAALGPETLRFYRGLGINLKQIYGITEASGLVCVQPDGEIKPDSVGRPLAGVDVKLSDDGEILVRCGGLFESYYRNPEATATAKQDGWLHTGDAGFFDGDGHLVVVDRAVDLATLDDGTSYAPQFVENKLKFSPYIKEAVALGAGRPFVAALINIDGTSVGRWAERRSIPYTSYTDLCLRPEVHALIRAEVDAVNADLPAGTTIRRFLILAKELDPDDGEITRTRKLRRRLIASRYEDLISAVYGGSVTARMATTVTYEDGQQREIEAELAIGDLAPPVVPVA
jgi:long-chain acyl-CoA synthetase